MIKDDELGGEVIKECAGLRLTLYSYEKDNNKEEKIDKRKQF